MKGWRKCAAIVWALLMVIYGLQHEPFSQWWLCKTVVVGAFVYGLLWPTKEKDSEELK